MTFEFAPVMLIGTVQVPALQPTCPGAISNMLVLMHRGLSIAGGTSEIKRNQIGERLLGLPRDPLIK